MSFAVWKLQPPFTFKPEDPEQVYQVGAVWVVTDNPARATQAEVDKVLNPTPVAGAAVAGALQTDKALDALQAAIDSGDTLAGLRAVKSLLQEQT